MLKGKSRDQLFPIILDEEMDDSNPTVFMSRMQTLRESNASMIRYMKGNSRKTEEAQAEAMTKADYENWADAIREIKNFEFANEEQPRESITDPAEIKKVARQIGPAAVQQLMNKSRDIFSLTEASKKELSSSSGQGLKESTPEGSDTIASDVRSEGAEPSESA